MGIYVNEEVIEEIKAQNDIINVISKYIPLKKSGRNYKGLCPFHQEKTPSFVVSDEKQFYHCFGCGESGDVIDFVMKIENLDFVDAITLLGEQVGIQFEEFSISKQEKKEINRKNKIYEINRVAAIFYYQNLVRKDNNGLKYLYKRGLNIQTIKRFGLGYAEDDWESLNKYLLGKGYDQNLIYEAGLVVRRKDEKGFYDRFRNRVIFPIINTTGKVIGFGGRAIDDTTPKYLNSPETSVFNKGNNLFGLNLAKKEVTSIKQIIVVEGYMDVISLYQNGIKNVVASLGTALTKNQGILLKRYADEIIIAYDSDTAGRAATLRGLDILDEIGCQVKVVNLLEEKDPDEYVIKKGKENFLKEIEQALPLIDYKILLAEKENDLSTTVGRINFVKSITGLLKSIKSPVVLDAYIKKIARESQISIEAIKSEIYGNNTHKINKEKPRLSTDKYRSKTDRYTNKYNIEPIKPAEKLGYLEAERCLLKLMISNKNIYNKINMTISKEIFNDNTHKKIAAIVYSLYETYDELDIDMILKQLTIEEISVLHQINDSIIPIENVDKALVDYVHTIQKQKLEFSKTEIEEELKKLESIENKTQEQIARIRELCMSYEKILKELKKL